MSDNGKHDPLALAKTVLSDPAMDQALTWLIELETANAVQRQAFLCWLEQSPDNRAAYETAQAVWTSQSLKDAAAAL